MERVNVQDKIHDVADSVSSKAYLSMPLVNWRPILAKECQVYVFNEGYLAKRFDQINYKFCNKDAAKEILVDNLYALLRFKYFPKLNDEIDDRITQIIKGFTTNLKTSLIRVSFTGDDDCEQVTWLPDGCLAFRNGVYDFRNDDWLFKYDMVKIGDLKNTLFLYNPKYIITWYLNINFQPLEFSIQDFSLEEFVDIMKNKEQTKKNLCFELMYNMAHNLKDEFEFTRFQHLCEILGYLCYQSFSQKFVLFVGSGQNGKNSLIDGCFTDRVIPKPAANDLASIETDRFITGSLENKAHNIYLETTTDERAYKDNTHLKALTGSQDQTIEDKGISKYSGIINCKYLWSANDQDKVKFSDTTIGFKRRINIFEIWYHWDEKKSFLKMGDYYDTTFSEDLHEIKNDPENLMIFIYFAMYGIMLGTKNFTKSFGFTYNDWRISYTDLNYDFKERILSITPRKIFDWISASPNNWENGKRIFYDIGKRKIYASPSLFEMGYEHYDGFLKFLQNEDDFAEYFVNHSVYMSVSAIQAILGDDSNSLSFTSQLKKTFNLKDTLKLDANKSYVKCRFISNKLQIIGE